MSLRLRFLGWFFFGMSGGSRRGRAFKACQQRACSLEVAVLFLRGVLLLQQRVQESVRVVWWLVNGSSHQAHKNKA